MLAFNKGAAFSFLAGEDGWQRWLFAAIAIAACVAMAWLLRRGGSALFCAGLALIIGGALGNLYDRLVLGHVVDFLLFHYRGWYFPAFNVADSAITIGAAALIVDSFLDRRPTLAASARQGSQMDILLANPRGFCAGVDRAIAIVEQALRGSARRSTFATKSCTTASSSTTCSGRVRCSSRRSTRFRTARP